MISIEPVKGAGSDYWKVAQALCKERGATQYKLQFNRAVLEAATSEDEFKLRYAVVTLPDAVRDRQIRWLIDNGETLENAYRKALAADLIPPEPMRPCILEVFKSKYYDPDDDTWKPFGPNHTCMGFHHCLAEYIPSLIHDPKQTVPQERRIRIAADVYAPSPAEAQCIKNQFVFTGNLVEAYEKCGAMDILPSWPGALEFITQALQNQPGESLYNAIKNAYMIYTVIPPVSKPPDTQAPDKPADKSSELTLVWALAGAAVFILMLRKGI